ncbi:hypothetical protein PYW07_012653 [Mythimna separata]|uniref:Uncharacterized protein n=1 Tax=Mythimna separata TaxID=271217 RepID=A0AAD7Y8P0_MYTSE|nr:hypothetical protein PYW07_012653 [Mythimna separata]
MKILILLSSIVLVSASQKETPPRSVNVAVETSFLFDPKDLDDNKSFVKNVKGFLDKLYNILEPPHTNQRSNRAEIKSQEIKDNPNFIEVVKDIGSHFVNMPGTKIKEAVNTIHGEVSKITDNKKGQEKIKEILPDEKLKEMLKASLSEWLKSNPEEMRRIINSTITEGSPLLTTFARRVNSYYNELDVKKLNKILKKFRRNIENDIDNTKVLKELLHNAIIKKYNSLNETAKQALVSDLKVFSGFLIAKNMFSGLSKDLSVLTRRNSPNKEENTTDFHEEDMTYNALRRSIDKQLRDAREKNDEKKNEKGGSEIIVDNVEVFVDKNL